MLTGNSLPARIHLGTNFVAHLVVSYNLIIFTFFLHITLKQITMKVLVLFDGNGCVSKELKQMGHEVKTLDILFLPHIDLPIDILTFTPRLLGTFVPDMIWASPPCETWSIKTAMKGGGNLYWESIKDNNRVVGIVPRTNFDIDKRLTNPERITNKRILHTQLVKKTLDIIEYYTLINPELIWFIENPATGFIRHYINEYIDCIENKTTYCKYGSPYRKETSIFSNINLNLKWCPKKTKNVVNTCGHTDCFCQRWDDKKQPTEMIIPQSYLERSHIPGALCVDIFTQAVKQYEVLFGSLV